LEERILDEGIRFFAFTKGEFVTHLKEGNLNSSYGLRLDNPIFSSSFGFLHASHL
jgi:hypothetical protein